MDGVVPVLVKMRRVLLQLTLISLFFSCTMSVCAKETLLTENLKQQVLEDIRVLASDEMAGRKPGTQGHDKAKTYLLSRYAQIGVKPINDTYIQSFSFERAGNQVVGNNVIGMLQGKQFSQSYIVFTAHYDHLGQQGSRIYNGADDNASGVSALLALADHFKQNPAHHSLIFIATDGEEDGLHGAKAFLDDLPIKQDTIMMNINLDMISYGGRRKTLFVAGSRSQPILKQLVKESISQVRTKRFRLKTGHDRKSVGLYNQSSRINWQQASDHGPFIKKGIPYLYFGVDVHKHYHRRSDDFSNLNQGFFIDAVAAIFHIVDQVDRAPLRQLKR